MKLQNRALLIRLGIESWGTTRQDKEANQAVADAKNSKTAATRVTKRLAPDDALKAVKSKAEEARKYVRSVTQPWSDDGARLLDAAQLFNLQDELRRNYHPAWWAEVQKVVAKLDYYRDQWGPANLGDLYDPSLYPTRAKMEAEFKWDLDVLPLNPDSKEVRMILGNEYVEQMQQQAEQRLVAQLAERIAEPISNMVRRLSDPEGAFKDTLVSNVEDIAKLIPALNLTGDPRLDALQKQIEADLVKHDADVLRRNSHVRTATAQKAQAILDRMNDFLPVADQVASVSPSADDGEAERLAIERDEQEFFPAAPKDETEAPAQVAVTAPVAAVAPVTNWRDRLRQQLQTA